MHHQRTAAPVWIGALTAIALCASSHARAGRPRQLRRLDLQPAVAAFIGKWGQDYPKSVMALPEYQRFVRRAKPLTTASDQQRVAAFLNMKLDRVSRRWHRQRSSSQALSALFDADGLPSPPPIARGGRLGTLARQSRRNLKALVAEAKKLWPPRTDKHGRHLDAVLRLVKDLDVAYVHMGASHPARKLPLVPTGELVGMGVPEKQLLNTGPFHDEVKQASRFVYFLAVPFRGRLTRLTSTESRRFFADYGAQAVILTHTSKVARSPLNRHAVAGMYVMYEADLGPIAVRKPSEVTTEWRSTAHPKLPLLRRAHRLRASTDLLPTHYGRLLRDLLRTYARSAPPVELMRLKRTLSTRGEDLSDLVLHKLLEPLGISKGMELRHLGAVPADAWRPFFDGPPRATP